MKSNIQDTIIKSIVFTVVIVYGLLTNITFAQQATHESVDEFVDMQRFFCIDQDFNISYENQIVDGHFAGACSTSSNPLIFVPPIANFVGAADNPTNLCASVDYAGMSDVWINIESGGSKSFDTKFGGFVKRKPIGDGREKVDVHLKTNNALVYVLEDIGGSCDFTAIPVFGNHADDVLADPVNNPAVLGESLLKVTFTQPEGDDLPSLFEILFQPFFGNAPGDLELQKFSFNAHASDGNSNVIVNQVMPVSNGSGKGLADGLPAEIVILVNGQNN